MRRHVVIALFLLIGCDLVLVTSGLRFNPAIDGDLKPTTVLQAPPTFSDGPANATGDDGIVSEAYPDLADKGTLRQLHRSECFWMRPGNVNLSWELIATTQPADDLASPEDPDPENPTLPIDFGLCTTTDPMTRHPPIDGDGDPVTLQPGGTFLPNGRVDLVECTGPANLYNACRRESGCRAVPAPVCPGQGTGFPFCGLRCARAVSQPTTFRVQVITDLSGTQVVADNGMSTLAREKTFATTFRPVATTITMARPLLDRGPRGVNGNSLLTWSTPVAADGMWQENFSPELYITRVRIFEAASGDQAKRYLVPEAIRVDDLSCGRDGTGSASLETCPQLGSMTPTNATWKYDRPLEWAVELRPGTVRPGKFYYIEYVVADKLLQAPGATPTVRLHTESVDLGEYDYRARVTASVYLENNGGSDVWFDGASTGTPAGFRVYNPVVPVDRPFVLRRGAALELFVERQPLAAPTQAWADEADTLSVRVRNGGRILSATLHGEAYDYGLSTFAWPASVSLARGPRPFLFFTTTANPVRVRSMTLRGTGANAFIVRGTDPCNAQTPLCLDIPVPAGGGTVYRAEAASTSCVRTRQRATLTFVAEECVTQGVTCGPADDWRPVPDLQIALDLPAGTNCGP